MEQLSALVEIIKAAIDEGKTVTITADDVTIGSETTVINNLSVTME